MRVLLSDMEEKPKRLGYKLPLLQMVCFAILTMSFESSILRVFFAVGVIYNLADFISRFQTFRNRVKGKEREKALELFSKLATRTPDEVGAVLVLRGLSIILRASVLETWVFVQNKLFLFILLPERVEDMFSIPGLETCLLINKVLCTRLEKLPEFLAHEKDSVRIAARIRYDQLITKKVREL